MKTYPSINGPQKFINKPCYLFVKSDGSNLRFEWSRKRGWYKFGTRKLLFDESHPVFGSSIDLFINKYGDDLEKIFKKSFNGINSVTVFCEWFGAKSLGGAHEVDDPKEIVLFDVNPVKKGILGPKEFLDTFGHLDVAELIYQGGLTEELIEQVRKEEIDIESKYEIRSKIPEGVIAKGDSGHRLWMCKIKTDRYREILKAVYQKDWIKYWE